MSGRRFVAFLVGAGLLASGLAILTVKHRQHPNIVIVVWGSASVDRLTPYGDGEAATPWLEKVAERGVVFDRTRSPSSEPLESQASMMTGLLPEIHRASSSDSPLAPSHTTLAEELNQVGYDTVLISNDPLIGKEGGLDQGFDQAFVVPGPASRVVDELELDLARRREDAQRMRRPIFLLINLDGERPAEADPGSVPSDVDRALRGLDAQSARIEQILRREGLQGQVKSRLANTVLVVMSGSAIQVPLMIHWPGRFEGGERFEQQVRLQDLYTTLLDVGGVEHDGNATPNSTTLLEKPLTSRP